MDSDEKIAQPDDKSNSLNGDGTMIPGPEDNQPVLHIAAELED